MKNVLDRVKFVAVALAIASIIACTNENSKTSLADEEPSSPQMNVLWLVVEDMSPILSVYGDNTLETPAISRLAEEGVVYTNVYSTSGVCAPSRAALALGMYPSAVGANHMRTTSNTDITGLPKYEAVPPVEAKMLSHYLRESGYYTTNNYKTDYQFKAPKAAWDESGPYAHWRNRPANKPFFAVVNFTTTHESGLFEPYGIRHIESRHYFSDDRAKIKALPKKNSDKTVGKETPRHLSTDTVFNIPPYLPDTPLVRRDMWKMYNNLAETDKQIAAVLKQLEDDGLYDNTIIVFYADHGGPLPRQKRLIYDSGLKVPMIIRFPDGKYAGTRDDQLISFVDFAPSTLAVAGQKIPSHMHGKNFLDGITQINDGERQYIHAAADRFDGFTDAIRAVKNKQYKYIRNYRPEQAYYMPVVYRERIPTMQELLRLRDADELNEIQAQWFRQSKPEEELFDTERDPHELNNLASDPRYKDILIELRNENDRWLKQINDQPNMPERELINSLWQEQNAKPQTKEPIITINNGLVEFSSNTEGAVISYSRTNVQNENVIWELYTSPFKAKKDSSFKVVAHRIGFEESEIVEVSLN